MADAFHQFETDQAVGQQSEGPVSMPFRWLAAGQGDQVCFHLARQFAHGPPCPRPFVQGTVYSFGHVTALHLADGPRSRHGDLGQVSCLNLAPVQQL